MLHQPRKQAVQIIRSHGTTASVLVSYSLLLKARERIILFDTLQVERDVVFHTLAV